MSIFSAGFVSRAENAMDRLYPGWSTTKGYNQNRDTICIPQCKEAIHQKEQKFGPTERKDKFEVMQKSRKAETNMLFAFQKLKGIGGILLSDFASKELTNKISGSPFDDFARQSPRWQIDQVRNTVFLLISPHGDLLEEANFSI